MPKTALPGYLTTKGLAAALGRSRQRVYQLAEARGVEPLQVGNAHLWPLSAVKALKPGKPGRKPKGGPKA